MFNKSGYWLLVKVDYIATATHVCRQLCVINWLPTLLRHRHRFLHHKRIKSTSHHQRQQLTSPSISVPAHRTCHHIHRTTLSPIHNTAINGTIVQRILFVTPSFLTASFHIGGPPHSFDLRIEPQSYGSKHEPYLSRGHVLLWKRWILPNLQRKFKNMSSTVMGFRSIGSPGGIPAKHPFDHKTKIKKLHRNQRYLPIAA